MWAALTSTSTPRLRRRVPEELGQRGRQPKLHAAGPHKQRQARRRQLQQRHAVGRHRPEVGPPLLRERALLAYPLLVARAQWSGCCLHRKMCLGKNPVCSTYMF